MVETPFTLVVCLFPSEHNKYSTRLRVLAIIPFASIAMSATLAPRIEIYTMLVCFVHKPEIFREACPPPSYRHAAPTSVQRNRSEPIVSRLDTPPAHATESVGLWLDEGKLSEWGWVGEDTREKPGNACASDPVVREEVAKLTLGKFFVPSSFSLHIANIAYQLFFVLTSKEYWPMALTIFLSSDIYIHGYHQLPNNWLVGVCKSRHALPGCSTRVLLLTHDAHSSLTDMVAYAYWE